MDRYSALASLIPAFAGLVDDSARRQAAWLQTLLEPGSRVLDAGCGGGRHSLLLAEAGHRVIGLDASEAALEIAARQGSKLGVAVDWQHGDLRQPPAGPFEMVLLMDVTLGVFDDAEALEVLRTLRSRLAPRGRIVVELYHLPFWRGRLGEVRWAPGSAHPTLAVERSYREEPGYLIDDVVVIDGDDRQTMPTQRLRAWSVEEAVSLLAAAGFKLEGLWGPRGFTYGDAPTPLPHDAAFFWVVARR